MEIQYFKSLASTQTYLCDAIKNQKLHAPIAVITESQYAGVGSRENTWIGGEGNFFVSMAIDLHTLPKDLALGSASIYFSYIMKKILSNLGSAVWLKWPNDFYLEDKKVGGTITQKVGQYLVFGMGINIKSSPEGHAVLEENISAKYLLKDYIEALEKYPSWKQVFSEFEIEFCLSRKFSAHHNTYKLSLTKAVLCEDGSLLIEGKKVYSLR